MSVWRGLSTSALLALTSATNLVNSFVGVVAHPFFAVTSADGSFQLKGLPPGTYTIEAWHEKFGTKTASVTIGAKESKDVAFTFSG